MRFRQERILLISCFEEKPYQKSIVDQIVAGSSAKPFFLVWDKVYQKLNSEDDEKWLVRATEPVFEVLVPNLEKNELLR